MVLYANTGHSQNVDGTLINTAAASGPFVFGFAGIENSKSKYSLAGLSDYQKSEGI